MKNLVLAGTAAMFALVSVSVNAAPASKRLPFGVANAHAETAKATKATKRYFVRGVGAVNSTLPPCTRARRVSGVPCA